MIDLNTFIHDQSKVLLGQGAFGSVYKWTNNITQQELAVKVINGSSIKSEAQFKDLKNEISILKQIKSPNIVQIIDVQETAGVKVYYLFMEYCDGGDLYKLLEREQKLSEDKVKKLMADLLNGYLQLLINQVIHRDLKPHNIVLHQNTFKIADFGFARYVQNSENQMLDSSLGTQEYASPQIINKEQYTTKSDIWSFGIILYQCLYGDFPFPKNGQLQFFEQLQNNEFEYPKNVEVSQQIKNLISKCLVVQEENRISWQQLMKDPYILEFFQAFDILEKDIKQQELLVIQALHKTYFNNYFDVDVIFQKYDTSGQQRLNLEQFTQIIRDLNHQLQEYYIEYIYNNIVNQKTKQISKEELEIWLNKQVQEGEEIKIGDYIYYNNQESLIHEGQDTKIRIFKGRKVAGKEIVAIKIIPNDRISEKKVNIEILKKLESPHIVRVFDLIENPDQTYLIQEFCDGGDLQKLLETAKVLPELQVKQIIAGLLDALFQLQKNGIAYRQLNLSHILFKQKQVKLINNFNNTREVQNSQTLLHSTNFDTQLQYLSEEAKNSDSYFAFKNDIYSLGAVILDCIWENNPLSDKYNTPEVKFDEEINISKELQQVILKCLEKDQIKRITLSELMRDPFIIQFYDKCLPIELQIIQKEQEIIQIIKKYHSIDDLFEKYAQQNQQQVQEIDLDQFSTIIRLLYQQELHNYEIEYIYDKINTQKQLTINREQLKIWINSELLIPQYLKLDQQRRQITQIPTAISKLLIPAMRQYKTDVQKLFDVFEEKDDKVPLGFMTFERFKEIIKNVKKSTEDTTIEDGFKYFVKNNDDKIMEKDFIQMVNELL